MTRTRPPAWRVALAALFAAGCVVAYALGLPPIQWAVWFGLFLAMEITREKGATFSECFYAWIGVRPVRRWRWLRVPVAGSFMTTVGLHLCTAGVWAGARAVVATGTPLGLVIVGSLIFERREP